MALPDWIPRTARCVLAASHTGQWQIDRLSRRIDTVIAALKASGSGPRRVGLLMDNAPDWIAADLATHCTGDCAVPLPSFFSPSQHAYMLRAAAVDVLFCSNEELAASLGFGAEIFAREGIRLFCSSAAAPQGNLGTQCDSIQKITFTSGTTGAPKGVCLTLLQQIRTAKALVEAIADLGIKRHLVTLPLSVLLENVAGVYAPLLMGATCICPPLDEVGMDDGRGFDAARYIDAIARYRPESAILLPQMLLALVTELEAGRADGSAIGSLKFAAVGGGQTPASLIQRARQLGLPVYEGYGLSECASVVTLNVPGADKPGTVGRPLPGMEVRAAADGELEIHNHGFCGYVGMPETTPEQWLRTGDLGAIDVDGFISITGRKKNVLITSFGRNISPEWPENLLLDNPLIAQAAVFGEARPHLVAVLVTAAVHVEDNDLDQAVSTVNRQLPPYARIHGWIRACSPFSPRNGLATANGRICRDAVWNCYARQIHHLYETESTLS